MKTFILCPAFCCGLSLVLYTLLCVSACMQPVFPFFGTHETVVLHVPPSNADYLFFIDEAGAARKIALSPGQDEVRLVLEKNRVTPFLFCRGETDPCPLGCIYPYDTASDKAGGFTALVLYRIFILSQNDGETVYSHISRFNWGKLKAVTARYEDPWILDHALIAEKIAEGTFSTRHIKKRR